MNASSKRKGKKAPGVKSRRSVVGNLPRGPTQRRQVAALPYRRTAAGNIEILLITSRATRRFIIPKGWPVKRLSDPDAAAKEAFEEAGVIGRVKRRPIGTYSYWKRLARNFELLKVDVYALEVRAQKDNWPEKGSRKLSWLRQEDAATLSDEPELMTLIERFRD